jgi:adenylosuccinate lyase
MIPRYTPADFAKLWSASHRYQVWLEVELAACEAMEHARLVPAGIAEKIRAKKLVLDADRIESSRSSRTSRSSPGSTRGGSIAG